MLQIWRWIFFEFYSLTMITFYWCLPLCINPFLDALNYIYCGILLWMDLFPFVQCCNILSCGKYMRLYYKIVSFPFMYVFYMEKRMKAFIYLFFILQFYYFQAGCYLPREAVKYLVFILKKSEAYKNWFKIDLWSERLTECMSSIERDVILLKQVKIVTALCLALIVKARLLSQFFDVDFSNMNSMLYWHYYIFTAYTYVCDSAQYQNTF